MTLITTLTGSLLVLIGGAGTVTCGIAPRGPVPAPVAPIAVSLALLVTGALLLGVAS